MRMASTDLTLMQLSPIEDIIGDLTSCQLFAIFEELAADGGDLASIARHERIAGILRVISALEEDYTDVFGRLITETAAHLRWSEDMVRYVIRDFFSLLSDTSLHTFLESEIGPESAEQTFVSHHRRGAQHMLVAPEVVLHILSAGVPTSAIEAIILSLAAGVPCVIRTSSRERAAARFFLNIMRTEAPELARHVAVVTWPHDDPSFAERIAEAQPTIVFHGSEASIHAFEQSLPQPTKIHAFGHRISFGLVSPGAHLTQETIRVLAHRIARDVTLFEGRGCMSMQSLFVMPHASQLDLAERIADALINDAFPAIDKEFPRTPPPEDIAAEHMQQIGVAEFSGNAHTSPLGNALVWEEPALRSSPGWRHLHLSTVSDFEVLLDAISPYRHALSTAGIYLDTRRTQSTAKLLGQAGVRRICPIGRMQRPLILSAHDGQQRIRPWFRICDLEG